MELHFFWDTGNLFFTVQETGKPNIRYQNDGSLERALFLAWRWPPSHWTLTCCRERKRLQALGASFYKGTNSIMSALITLWNLNYLPKAPSLNTTTWGIRASMHELRKFDQTELGVISSFVLYTWVLVCHIQSAFNDMG